MTYKVKINENKCKLANKPKYSILATLLNTLPLGCISNKSKNTTFCLINTTPLYTL